MPRSAVQLPKSASVVIVGGGVIGASAAFHLAEAGVDVVLQHPTFVDIAPLTVEGFDAAALRPEYNVVWSGA